MRQILATQIFSASLRFLFKAHKIIPLMTDTLECGIRFCLDCCRSTAYSSPYSNYPQRRQLCIIRVNSCNSWINFFYLWTRLTKVLVTFSTLFPHNIREHPCSSVEGLNIKLRLVRRFGNLRLPRSLWQATILRYSGARTSPSVENSSQVTGRIIRVNSCNSWINFFYLWTRLTKVLVSFSTPISHNIRVHPCSSWKTS